MNSRRRFLLNAPIGMAGALWACRDASHAVAATAEAQTTQPAGVGAGAGAAPRSGVSAASRPLLRNIPAQAPVLTWTPRHQDLAYTFGGAAPRQRIKPGTRIVTWTEDCFDGVVKTARDLPSKVMPPGHDNPQTGPFYIEGADAGDTIAVHILRLEPARPYGVSSFSPGFGALVGTDQTAMLGAEFPETTWRYEVDSVRRVARAHASSGTTSWEVPLAPFLGCIGVAPAGGEVRTTLVPGAFGGNMDCPEVRQSNTVYLGVNAPGALLSFGDGHYAMGEGEIMGAAIEGAMNVEVYVELIKKTRTAIPRIENADEVMFVGSGRPLEDAARVAFKELVQWVRGRTHLRDMDAYQFVSQNTRATIVQLVDPEYTVLVRMDKARLPA